MPPEVQSMCSFLSRALFTSGLRWSDSTAIRAPESSVFRFLWRCATFLGDSGSSGDGVRAGSASPGSMKLWFGAGLGWTQYLRYGYGLPCTDGMLVWGSCGKLH